jgi:murein DD-endopeptidase MepM/ murein hydrolase activator NlpD
MKLRLIFAFFFFSAKLFAQDYPEILQLKSRNPVFAQYQEDVQQNSRDFFSGKSASPTFYAYTAQNDDTVLTLAARCSIRQETLSTLNSIAESSAEIRGKKLILSSADGIFVPEIPQTAMELLISSEYKNEIRRTDENGEQTVPLLTVNGRKFYFLWGAKFSSSLRAYFLIPGLAMPLEKSVLTSSFGKRQSPITGKFHTHKGIDLASPIGSSVLSCREGKIKTVERGNPVYGNYIIVHHPNGMESLYAHLSRISVEKGEDVRKGQKIGEVGVTGMTTGPHLHFEIKQNGEPLDPEKYLKKQ